MTTKKKDLGQFFTTNYSKIFQDLKIPNHVQHVIEPFAGAGDLFPFILNGNPDMEMECYDIDPKAGNIIKRDTLQEPPCYDDKFVVTNPPYLARNKCADKTYFEKYQANDLYKCFVKQLISSNALGGAIIIPVNFWCSARRTDVELRRDFLRKYSIIHLNIFEEPVFSDTTYSVCAFQFERRLQAQDILHVKISVYPAGKHFSTELLEKDHFLIGGEMYYLERTNQYTITRLTKDNKDKQCSKILLKCIDDMEPIGMSIADTPYIDETSKSSARSYATLVIDPPLSFEQQEELVVRFNKFLDEKRRTYHSLFLSNYRENHRKRISFDLAYHITGHLLETC